MKLYRVKMSIGLKLHPLLLLLLPRRPPRTTTVFFSPSTRTTYFPITPTSTLRLFSCTSRTMAESSESVQVRVKENIHLTDIENKIFERLLQTLTHFQMDTQLRVAGGWVRDKLLGKECYDIDIAVDNMLGSEFVDKVTKYMASTGEEVRGLAVIPSNPDQSKHLETAKMRLFDMWIDFVNLRAEDYSENSNSRIPTMRFGTAEEDAYRRDLTINSLFYNINNRSIEDYTGRGIADLKSGKIVTPLPPKDTFLDDPLRVLRAIRFGARFDFVLDEKLKDAAASDDVRDALEAKISRERVGIEVDLMIAGNQPVRAMNHISDLTLFWIVFRLPPNLEAAKSEGCDRLCIAYMDCARNLVQLVGCTLFSDEQRRLSLYAALFLPLRKTIYKDNKAKKIPVVNYIFRESLKRKASDAEAVINIHRALEKFLSLIPFLTSEKETQLLELDHGIDIDGVHDESKLRISAGFLLRDIKDFWRAALLMSTMLYPVDVDCTEDFLKGQYQLDKRRDLFKAAEAAIIKLGLDKVWEVKPLVNGKEIMTVLQLNSGKPIVKEWQQKLLAWQLAHPSGTAEECLDFMKQSVSKRMKLTE